MKKVLFIAALFASSMAMAGNDNANPCGNNGNNCGGGSVGNTSATNGPISNNSAGGAGGQGGAGGNAGAIAGANSAAEAKAIAAAIAAQQQKQKQDQEQQQAQIANGGKSVATAEGGKAKAEGGKAVGNGVVDVKYEGAERSAPGVFAAPIPTVATSCRLYLFGGGTNVNGAVSGTFPIGNDQSCLTDKGLANMLRINQQFPGAYTANDLKIIACKVEGMSDTDSCKALKK